MADAEFGQFFERPMEGETHHQFLAFTAYRDMGLNRSLRGAAQLFYADGGPGYREDAGGMPESGTDTQLARFKRWSVDNSWRARVEAYDIEQTRRRALTNEQRRRDLEDSTWRASTIGINASVQRIFSWSRDPSEIPGSQVVALLRESVQMARLSVGEATERIASDDPEQPVLDYSVMSDEDLDAMNAIHKKYFGDR